MFTSGYTFRWRLLSLFGRRRLAFVRSFVRVLYQQNACCMQYFIHGRRAYSFLALTSMYISRDVNKSLTCNTVRNPLLVHKYDLRRLRFRVIGQDLFHCKSDLRDIMFQRFAFEAFMNSWSEMHICDGGSDSLKVVATEPPFDSTSLERAPTCQWSP